MKEGKRKGREITWMIVEGEELGRKWKGSGKIIKERFEVEHGGRERWEGNGRERGR